MSFSLSRGSGTQVTFHVRYEGIGVPTDLHIFLLDPKNPTINQAKPLVGYDNIPAGLNPKVGFDIPYSTNPPAFPLAGGKLEDGIYTFALTWSFQERGNETDPDQPLLIQPPLQTYTPLPPPPPAAPPSPPAAPAPPPAQPPNPPAVQTGPGTLHAPQTPPGPPHLAGDQCWEFTMQDPSISENEELYISGTGVGECVDLNTASAVAGAATFVVCCKKLNGKCKNCDAYITFAAVNPRTKEKLTVGATIKCRPGS